MGDNITDLLQAIECHKQGRLLEAALLYGLSIKCLLHELNHKKSDFTAAQVAAYKARIKEYVGVYDNLVKLNDERFMPEDTIEHISIKDNAIGYSYEKVFGKYLDANVKEVVIREPHLSKKFQFKNLLMFIELLVKHCKNLRFIRITTGARNDGENQEYIFKKILDDLETRSIKFNTVYEDFHDRKIQIDNGHVFHLGYGLHYFKKAEEYSLGSLDYDLRKCRPTDITVFRTKNY